MDMEEKVFLLVNQGQNFVEISTCQWQQAVVIFRNIRLLSVEKTYGSSLQSTDLSENFTLCPK